MDVDTSYPFLTPYESSYQRKCMTFSQSTFHSNKSSRTIFFASKEDKDSLSMIQKLSIISKYCLLRMISFSKKTWKRRPTIPAIGRQSTIQVLSRLIIASLQSSHDNFSFHLHMHVCIPSPLQMILSTFLSNQILIFPSVQISFKYIS